MNARWLKFLCSRKPVQTDVWPADAEFLRHFATVFGLPPDERRKFVGLSLLGRLWRAVVVSTISRKGRPNSCARLTHVTGWEHFDRCRRDGAGLILCRSTASLPACSNRTFAIEDTTASRSVSRTTSSSAKGLRTPAAKRFELARQMHAAKHLLARGGIVFNLPDARQNLDNSRVGGVLRTAAPTRHRVRRARAQDRRSRCADRLPIFAARILRPGVRGTLPRARASSRSPTSASSSLVGQYADFLRDEWRRYPWNIDWSHLRHFCRLPKFNPDALGENAIAPRARSGGARRRVAR